ncbi:MAG: transglycosylase domain-containing protein, partial [Candidatus Krumholzibacteriia bacterium]
MIGIAGLLAWEIHTSTFQSRLLSRYASRLTWDVHEGASPDPLRAPRGPYDVRHGYTRLARFLDLLQESGFDVAWQASPSAELASLAARGIPPPYREKDAPALHILDRGGRTLYGVSADRFHFREFVDVPPLVVHSLLYVENRQLLDAERPHLNPALDWDRLVLAGWRYAEDRLFGTGNLAGGSTLATQIQTFRHSPNGRTASVRDKLQQMAAASLRAYRDGADTRAARRRIIVDYLNSMPLGAAPGIGELTGLGDGLWAWFGTTLEQLVVDLALPEDGEDLSRKGRAYKQALALLLATRRPVLYLGADVAPLTRRLHFYLGELQREGVISARLAAAARDAQLGLRARAPRLPGVRYAERKAANTVRGELLELLDLRSLYDLDRLDLRVETTLDATAQAAVMATLEQLDDPGFLKANGFYGKRLLGAGDPDSVLYTFSLYESSPLGNRVLVHADSFDQPLDLNDGAKLELGSTAKLRTIANYLMVVSELYDRYRGVSRQELLSIEHNSVDPITYWAAGFARLHPQASRERTLRASLERRYSANPAAKFFTGGGLHTFENFNDTFEDDMTLRMAFRHSVNLVFIRLMRELVLYYTAELGYDERAIIENRNHPDRKALLTAAVDHESREHLWAAYKKYEGLDADAAVRKLCGKDAKRLRRFAIHFSSGTPQAPLDQLKREAVRLFPERTEAIESDMPRYHRAFAARRRKLNDEAWLLGRQPLEVWLVRDRRRNPGAGWTDLVERSATARRQSFDW